MRTFFISILIVAGVSGCGSSSGMSELDQLNINSVASGAIAEVVRCAAANITGDVPSMTDVETATEELIVLMRANPSATYNDGDMTRTLRQVTSDLATYSEKCDPAITRKLDRALQAS